MLFNIIINLVNYIKLINRFNNIVQLHEVTDQGAGHHSFILCFYL